MPKAPQEDPVAVEDFADLLRKLDEEGLAFAVIGGCAVGAYARRVGASVVSRDLDILVTEQTLTDLLALAPRWGAVVVKRPQPRSVPVAVLDWHGLEVNALTASRGLSRSDAVIESARDLDLAAHRLVVPLADPFELLANKLAVRRPKDLPHIDILRVFIHQEVVRACSASGTARARLAPARRYLDIEGAAHLTEELARAMAPHADLPPLRRFLASRWPPTLAADALTQVAVDSEERADLLRIIQVGRRDP